MRFFGALEDLTDSRAFADALRPLRKTSWVVYAKPPFGSPAQVLAYLGRYTHRVAIANSRLVSMADATVTFRWRDYRHGNAQKHMALTADEFIRRFLLHSLPDGFHRIRHYGFLANGCRRARLATIRTLLATALLASDLDPVVPHSKRCNFDLTVCPCCGGTLRIIATMPRDTTWRARGPPAAP